MWTSGMLRCRLLSLKRSRVSPDRFTFITQHHPAITLTASGRQNVSLFTKRTGAEMNFLRGVRHESDFVKKNGKNERPEIVLTRECGDDLRRSSANNEEHTIQRRMVSSGPGLSTEIADPLSHGNGISFTRILGIRLNLL